MRHHTMSSRNRCSFIALLLGALACGDGSAVVVASAGDAAAAPNAGPEASPPAPPAEPAPMGSAPAANGAGEGVGSGPIMVVPESPPAGAGGAEEGSASESPSSPEPASEPPASEPPVAEEPGERPTAEPPASEPPVAEEPVAEEPVAEEPVAEEPVAEGGSIDLSRGGDPTRQSATSRGPFGVTIVSTGLRDGPDYAGQTLHVPEGVEPPFAAVAIVPGRDEPESSIGAWGPFLASHGIVALTFGTNDLGDDADVRARALLDALETIRAENTRRGGPLEGKLALDRLGVMGWSAGGAGALRVASSTPSLRAAIAMAPYSPGGEFPDDQVPTLFLAGSADPRAGGQSQGVFESLPETTPKMLFEAQDGRHEIGNDPQNADGEIGLYGLSWLEVFLVGDERYRQFLEATPTQASDFRASLGSAF